MKMIKRPQYNHSKNIHCLCTGYHRTERFFEDCNGILGDKLQLSHAKGGYFCGKVLGTLEIVRGQMNAKK